ncbi:hypothetical protein D3C72_1698330 [compost metagenome]
MEGGQHIGIEDAAQTRQGCGEILNQTQRLGIDLSGIALALASDVAQLQTRLGMQSCQGRVEGMTDVEILAFLAQVDRPQAHGEKRPTQLFEDVPHGFARRQFPPPLLATATAIAAAPFVTGAAQAGNDALQLPMPCLRVLAHGYVSLSLR